MHVASQVCSFPDHHFLFQCAKRSCLGKSTPLNQYLHSLCYLLDLTKTIGVQRNHSGNFRSRLARKSWATSEQCGPLCGPSLGPSSTPTTMFNRVGFSSWAGGIHRILDVADLIKRPALHQEDDMAVEAVCNTLMHYGMVCCHTLWIVR